MVPGVGTGALQAEHGVEWLVAVRSLVRAKGRYRGAYARLSSS